MDLKKYSAVELNGLIVKARKRQRLLVKSQVCKVRKMVFTLLRAEGLTFEEVFGSDGTQFAQEEEKIDRRYVVKAKYRNPSDPSQTWTGRGLQPRWFKDAVAAGKSINELQIRFDS